MVDRVVYSTPRYLPGEALDRMAALTPELLEQLRLEMASMIQQGILAAQAQAASSTQRGQNPFSEDEAGNRGQRPEASDRRDRGGNSHYLSSKHSRLDSFQGDANAWTLWSFGFKRLVRSQNKALYKEPAHSGRSPLRGVPRRHRPSNGPGKYVGAAI